MMKVAGVALLCLALGSCASAPKPGTQMTEKPNYAGMTVNERLYTAGLIDAFDRAARSRNRARMIKILTEVEVGSPDGTADAIIEDPRKYGY